MADDRLCEMGRYGQKTGAGWYKYDENRRANPDPEVAALVKQWAAEAGIKQRADFSQKKSSIAASTRWSTKARAFWKKATPCAPSISTSSISTATASPRIAAARCGMPTPSA